jgi:hypothetical protein
MAKETGNSLETELMTLWRRSWHALAILVVAALVAVHSR